MNFYPFHLGDYMSHTAHLSVIEDAAYRRMLDLYYLNEAPLPADPKRVARLIRMAEHMDEVQTVLDEFFVLVDGAWRHDRCDEELAKMTDKREKAHASAAASVAARKRPKASASEPSATVEQQQPKIGASDERTLNERSADAQRTLSGRSATNTNTNTNTKSKEALSKTEDAPSARAEDAAKALLDRLKDDPDPGGGMDRPVQISVLLRAEGCVTTAMHPQVVEWAQAGVSDLVLAEAVAVAKTRKGQTRFGVEYIAPIVADILAGPKKRTDATWAMSDDGIARKARELGIPEHRWPATFAGLRQMCHDVARSAA